MAYYVIGTDGFKIGDKVKHRNKGNGIVLAINKNSVQSLGVEFEKNINGHDLENRCRYGLGWWCFPRDCELAEPINKYLVKIEV